MEVKKIDKDTVEITIKKQVKREYLEGLKKTYEEKLAEIIDQLYVFTKE